MNRRKFIENLSLITGGSSFFSFIIDGKNTLNKEGEKNVIEEQKDIVGIQITAPSTVNTNETFRVGVRILTEPFFSNWIPRWQRTRATVDGPFNQSPRGIHYMEDVLPKWEGEVNISGGEGYAGPEKFSFEDGSGPYEFDDRPIRRVGNIKFTTAGMKSIRIKDPVSGIEGVSNPIKVVTEPLQERLYWGDLHCHSSFCDGVRSPEEIYAFARDESFLDIFSLTGHTEAMTNAQWNYFKEVTNAFNEPNKFVTFIGGEWTSPKYGHRNIIYPSSTGPIIRSSNSEQDDLIKLFAIVRSHKALLIVNHPAGDETVWDNEHDSDVERLVEVYSIGGNNEIPAGPGNTFSSRIRENEVIGSHIVDGLKKGYRFGMIGTGDTHDGRPGNALHHLQDKPESYRHLKGPGLMGVWAKDLSRESVFDALWNRRVYGTTNNRTLLKFSINGHPMGSEINVEGNISVDLEAASSLIIQRIELVCDGETVQVLNPEDSEVSWSLVMENTRAMSSWYYVRLMLDKEHMAWSSPIWVNS